MYRGVILGGISALAFSAVVLSAVWIVSPPPLMKAPASMAPETVIANTVPTAVPSIFAPPAIPQWQFHPKETSRPASPPAPVVIGGTFSAKELEPPLLQNAFQATNPQAKPEVAVILIDDGSTTLDRASLAASNLPVSFAIDAGAKHASDWATGYFRGRHEVLLRTTKTLMLAAPSDVAVALAAYFRAVPVAVGVIDLPQGGFQDNRLMAQNVVSSLATDGYGLVTYERGLNAAAKLAGVSGVASVEVSAALRDPSTDMLVRLLDLASYQAVKAGRAAIAAPANLAILEAIAKWADSAQGRSVTLVPVTAVMWK